jgi:tRNA A37 threonylcarbamoyltransferase TsaD
MSIILDFLVRTMIQKSEEDLSKVRLKTKLKSVANTESELTESTLTSKYSFSFSALISNLFEYAEAAFNKTYEIICKFFQNAKEECVCVLFFIVIVY